MSYIPISGNHISEKIQTGLNANSTATVSSSLDISGNNHVSFSVVGASGTHGSHVVTLQCSLDDSNWVDIATTLTGTGMVDNVQVTTQFVRLKVTTVEGATSTIDIIIQAK